MATVRGKAAKDDAPASSGDGSVLVVEITTTQHVEIAVTDSFEEVRERLDTAKFDEAVTDPLSVTTFEGTDGKAVAIPFERIVLIREG
jgi:hypothetical protein